VSAAFFRQFAHGFASLACALLALVLVLASGACPGPGPKSIPSSLSLGGVSIERLRADALPRGPRVLAQAGDWVIGSDRLRLVVSRERGALLDLVSGDWEDDALGELRRVLWIDGWPASLELVSIEPVASDGRATLRIVERARELEVVSELRLAPGRAWVELISRVQRAAGSGALRVRLGDRVQWIGRAPFAPGLGFVERASRADLRWFARAGAKQSYALAFPERAADVRFETTLRGPTDQVALGPELVLGPGAVVTHRRLLAATPGALPEVATIAWSALGMRTGSAVGRVQPMPEWARVLARDERGRPVLVADVGADGRFGLPLPAGSYELELTAPGGSDRERVRIEAARAEEVRFIVPEAARIAYRIRDKAGAPLAARLVVRGVKPTADPVLGPGHLASGAGNIAYTRSGDGTLAVPPGRYEILVTSGLEHTIAELSVDVSADRGATLRAELERVAATPGWIACDFHLHAEPSGDSDVPLADRVTSLLAEGIEFAAATDHNHVTDYAPAIAALAAESALLAVPGVEITTSQWGHFNAFPLPSDARPPPHAELTPVAIFEHVRSIAPGAVVQINHPRMGGGIGYFDRGKLDVVTGSAERDGFGWGFDTIEVFNGFELNQPELVDANLTDWFALLDLGRIYTAVGNSDSHSLIWQWTGYPRTYVRAADGYTGATVADALRAGRAFVTTGPLIDLRVEGVGPGERASAKQGRAYLEVSVRAAPWIDVRSVEIRVDGEARVSFETPPDRRGVERIAVSHELVLERDAWVIAIARGATDLSRVLPGSRAKPFAFTNPVFIDVDGDGAFTSRRASAPGR
jgi:hypothetical protein